MLKPVKKGVVEMNFWKIGLLIVAGVVGYKIYQYCNAASDSQPLDNSEEDTSVQDNAAAAQEGNEEEQLS